MNFFTKTIGFFEIILLSLLISIYYYLTFVVQTDIQLHAQFIKDYTYGNNPFPVNFMYYFTVYLLSFFSSKSSALLVVSVYVLALITFSKYFIVKKIIYTELLDSYKNIEIISSVSSFILLFLFSLPSVLILKDFYYLLSFPPNIWHNSTTIFAMPFVVLLFWVSLKQLANFNTKRLLLISVLIVLNVLVKPSFIFVFIVAYPILLFKKYLFSKLFWLNLIPIVFSLLLIALEYYFIYFGVETTANAKSSVTIDLFHSINTWGGEGNLIYFLSILLSTIVGSFLFPIVFLSKNRKLFKEDMIQFALICMFIAFIIGNTFTETGARASDGNFLWQTFMCSFLVFFVCVFQLLKLIAAHPLKWKAFKIEIAFLMLHFISGIFYFSKIISTSSYF